MAVISPQWAIESQILFFCLRRHHCEARCSLRISFFPFLCEKGKNGNPFFQRDPARIIFSFLPPFWLSSPRAFFIRSDLLPIIAVSIFLYEEKGIVIPFDDHYNNVKLEKRCTFKLYGAYSNIIEEKNTRKRNKIFKEIQTEKRACL